ncbi:DUF58 domain-containing protein [Nakamurella silvestris]|nr:DUF58 domain-containing protein [Nakamurella silvestris]
MTALSRRLGAVTSLGWTALAGAVITYTVSRREGWQEFTVLAVALAAAVLMSLVFLIGKARYVVAVDLRTRRVTVGESAIGGLTVRNGSSRRLLPVRMEFPVGSGVASFPVPSLRRDAVHEEAFQIPTHRRAVITLGPARSVRGDAFGLTRRVVRWTDPEVLYVHPRTVPLAGAAAGLIKDLEGEATKDLSNSDISFHALRGYVPGDDRRYIHWKTSARTGTLMVRQFEETRRSHLALALATNPADYADPDEFEFAVAACASLAVQSARDERKFSVVTSRRPLVTPTPARLLDRLSEVEMSDGATHLVQICQHTAASVTDASVAVILCGSTPTPADIRRAGAAFPVGIRVMAIRVLTSSAVTIRTLGNVTVVTVGELDELGRALRSVRA